MRRAWLELRPPEELDHRPIVRQELFRHEGVEELALQVVNDGAHLPVPIRWVRLLLEVDVADDGVEAVSPLGLRHGLDVGVGRSLPTCSSGGVGCSRKEGG